MLDSSLGATSCSMGSSPQAAGVKPPVIQQASIEPFSSPRHACELAPSPDKNPESENQSWPGVVWVAERCGCFHVPILRPLA